MITIEQIKNQSLSLSDLPIEQRLIISLFDNSANWPSAYIKAGYPVLPHDYEHEGDILNGFDWFLGVIENAIDAGYIPYGLLCAPPCTAIASVGAMHWPEKDSPKDDYPGFSGKGYFKCEREEAETNVLICLEMKSRLETMINTKLKFWAIENPRGRMETLVPDLKPYRQMRFDPCDYGDPYKKETWLWGEFNTDLPKTPVPVLENSVHRKAGWKSIDLYYGLDKKTNLKYKDLAKFRNKTPKGFAHAFYKANQ